ncbi:MAG: universal stress protein [Syntrophales bacterium]|nr:universal stress protein [Syntrophales bacterium]
MYKPKKILVPSDFSEFSNNAIQKAADIAEEYGAQIILLHVISSDIQQCADQYCLSADLMRQFEEESIRVSKENMEKAAGSITSSRGIDVVFDIKKGIPSDVILAEQKKNDVDLIVIASHGRTGVEKLLMGSVAEKVVRGADCPVMVIKKGS